MGYSLLEITLWPVYSKRLHTQNYRGVAYCEYQLKIMKETTMATLAYSENIEQMAKELDFGGVKGLIKDVLATQILARISGFSEEVEGFEARYGKDYQTINNEFKKANENFKKFDDLMAWQFAQEGKEYWQGRLKELNDVL
jgi:hypothetical protein